MDIKKVDFNNINVENYYKKARVIILIVFLGSILILSIINYGKSRTSAFNGIVEKVKYNVQGFPTITIKGVEYFLSYNNWAFTVPIEKGDKMIKEKGKMNLKLIKRNGKDTIDFLINPKH
jgi:hypothetical protein